MQQHICSLVVVCIMRSRTPHIRLHLFNNYRMPQWLAFCGLLWTLLVQARVLTASTQSPLQSQHPLAICKGPLHIMHVVNNLQLCSATRTAQSSCHHNPTQQAAPHLCLHRKGPQLRLDRQPVLHGKMHGYMICPRNARSGFWIQAILLCCDFDGIDDGWAGGQLHACKTSTSEMRVSSDA